MLSNGATVETLQKKMNHFSKLCLAKNVHQLQELADSDQETEGDPHQEESEDDSFQKMSNFMKLLWLKILKFASSWIVVQKLMLCH